MQKKHVLITGGAGFIGSHMTRRCVSLGWGADVVDDLSGSPDYSRIIDCCGDAAFLKDDFASNSVLKLVADGNYDVVFHMAARARVSYSVEQPIESHVNNVEKTLKLIDACRVGKVKRFVFSSSSSVYGNANVLPTPEGAPMKPMSPYALQKAIIEEYLRLYDKLYGLDSVCLRYFNVFGPGQLGDSPYSTAIAAWLTAIGSNKPMRSDGDGKQSRDMCYVDNVIDANIAAATYEGYLSGMPINVACGESHTNNQILAKLQARYHDAKVVHAPTRVGDVRRTQADITLMRDVLGVTPGVFLRDGLERTIAWHESRADWRAGNTTAH